MKNQTVYHFFASSILFIYEGYEVRCKDSILADFHFKMRTHEAGSPCQWGIVTKSEHRLWRGSESNTRLTLP